MVSCFIRSVFRPVEVLWQVDFFFFGFVFIRKNVLHPAHHQSVTLPPVAASVCCLKVLQCGWVSSLRDRDDVVHGRREGVGIFEGGVYFTTAYSANVLRCENDLPVLVERSAVCTCPICSSLLHVYASAFFSVNFAMIQPSSIRYQPFFSSRTSTTVPSGRVFKNFPSSPGVFLTFSFPSITRTLKASGFFSAAVFAFGVLVLALFFGATFFSAIVISFPGIQKGADFPAPAHNKRHPSGCLQTLLLSMRIMSNLGYIVKSELHGLHPHLVIDLIRLILIPEVLHTFLRRMMFHVPVDHRAPDPRHHDRPD